MIYIKRDYNLIPKGLLDRAEEAQKKLMECTKKDRNKFIKANAKVWQEFKPYLSAMSFGKCWYSESFDDMALLDVDHFRPKFGAIRGKGIRDDAYGWLAFSVDNFRLSSQRSNRRTKDESTKKIFGKGNWFPLLTGSPRANWDNRCDKEEHPSLLDPTKKDEVFLIDVDIITGKICKSDFCMGEDEGRVNSTIEYYALNLENIVNARKEKIEEVNFLISTILNIMKDVDEHSDAYQRKVRERRRLLLKLKLMSCPDQKYSKAVRARLAKYPYQGLCAAPEEMEYLKKEYERACNE